MLGSGFCLRAVLALAATTTRGKESVWLTVIFVVPVLGGCGVSYWGIVQWNRFRTALTDPSDWLNGASSTLALAAAGNMIVHWSGSSLADLPWWQLQGWLLTTAASAIVLAALVTVISIARLARDPRTWLLGLAFSIGLAGEIAPALIDAPWFPFGSPSETGWLIALIVMAGAASLQPRRLPSQAATTSSTAAGMMVVLAVSMIVVAIDAGFAHLADRISALYAVLAFAGAGAQGVRIIRDLAQRSPLTS